MRKFMLTLFTLSFLVVVISACGSNSVVGTWENENGDAIVITKDKYSDPDTGLSVDYKIKGDKMILDVPLFGEIEFRFKVSGNKLTLFDGDSDASEVFTRKK